MSERGSGVGPFLFGIAIGAVLGFLFAPERGAVTRRRLGRKLDDLREVAGRKAEALADRVAEADEPEAEDVDADEGAEEEEGPDARTELDRRLAEARRRRRLERSRRRVVPTADEEEDEPVA